MKNRPLVFIWVVWLILFSIIILADIPGFLTEPNWVEYVTLGGGAALFIISGFIKGRRWWLLRRPYIAYFEPQPDAIQELATDYIENNQQEEKTLQVTIKFRTLVHIERVLFGFEGTGLLPHIKELYDWNLPPGQVSPSVAPPYHNEKDRWYWPYLSPLRRGRNNTIKVGVRFDVSEGFRGNLFVQPTIEEQGEAPRVTNLPYEVINRVG